MRLYLPAPQQLTALPLFFAHEIAISSATVSQARAKAKPYAGLFHFHQPQRSDHVQTTDRRAAERIARKAAVQLSRSQPAQSASVAASVVMRPAISQAQLAANQANAQLARGPVTAAGKAKSSMNALKHGLTSRTAVLDAEDAAEYTRRLDSYIDRLKPETEEELRLVQSILDSTWRIDRIQKLESAAFLKGKMELAGKFEDQPEEQRAALILIETQLKYEKFLKNIQLQEARLRRYAEKDQAELELLQQIRQRDEAIAAEAQLTSEPAESAETANGFVFSTTERAEPLASVALEENAVAVGLN